MLQVTQVKPSALKVKLVAHSVQIPEDPSHTAQFYTGHIQVPLVKIKPDGHKQRDPLLD